MLIGFKVSTVQEPRLYLATERTYLGALRFAIYSISFAISVEKIEFFSKLIKNYKMAKALGYTAEIFSILSIIISVFAISIFLYYIRKINGGEMVSKKEVIDPRIYMAAERTFLA